MAKQSRKASTGSNNGGAIGTRGRGPRRGKGAAAPRAEQTQLHVESPLGEGPVLREISQPPEVAAPSAEACPPESPSALPIAPAGLDVPLGAAAGGEATDPENRNTRPLVLNRTPERTESRGAVPSESDAGSDGRTTSGAAQPPLLFECAWEVCWQLGGIYTVLRSKAASMQETWDDRYFLIGPYNPATAALEFEERPTEGFIRETLDRLRELGMPCHYGHWLIPGRPRVILLDYRARFGQLDTDKYLMWKDHGISIQSGDGEVNEVTAFGFAVTEFFRHLAEVVGAPNNRRILAHFHEWMGGVAVPRIAHLRIPVTTIFTTHATLLGRYLANDNPEFYNHLSYYHPDAEAAKFLIWPRFAIERAAAHASVVFTTVSEVTAYEAEKLLGRAPDAVLPNGLNIQRFAALHEFQNLHRQYKEKIHEFVTGHFFPSYTFDLDRTLYFFTSGRYEYRNKGYDVFIEAMARLNWMLKNVAAPDRPTIVAFIVTRAQTRNINVATLQNQSMFEDLQNTCHDIEGHMGRKLVQAAATGRLPTYQELLPEEAVIRLKRAMHAWRTSRWPAIVTHDLADDAKDPILNHLRTRHLLNGADDPVKMIYHPEFVTATSPVLSLDYDQFVRGCHMGVFPSYYEPWGYTPMEAIALGVPAVTSDLAGFGAYVRRHVGDTVEQGVLVLDRRYRSFDDAADHLANYLFGFCQMNRRQRIDLRNKTERFGEMFDWSSLVKHYHDAHNMALERTGATGRIGKVEVRMV